MPVGQLVDVDIAHDAARVEPGLAAIWDCWPSGDLVQCSETNFSQN